MTQVAALQRLQKALRRLPGVGPKSAQRMAFHLLERDREGGQQIAAALHQALNCIQKCRRCQNFSESELCA
ncbi:MAG TPA: recombination protein RecR, partial [Gammaproteobacteria bacterium]|nr:recombination protein RecR [Gammaproteobacteria bacterium]